MAIASSLIAVETLPTQDQLWALEYLFCCDWSNGVKLSQSFSTDITGTQADNEQRRGLLRVPIRTLEASLLIYGQSMMQVQNMFARAAMGHWLVPLYCDEIFSPNHGPLHANVINVNAADLTSTRFCPGCRVAVVQFDFERKTVLQIQVMTVSSITSGSLHFGESFNFEFPAGCSLFPLMEAELMLAQDLAVVTDGVVTADIQAVEYLGDSRLDPLQQIGDLPSSIQQFNSALILDPDPDYGGKNSVGIKRSGNYSNIGQGKSLQVFGSRPRFSCSVSFLKTTRAAAINLVRFFESVGGRLKPFYVISPLTDFKSTGMTGRYINIVNTGAAQIDYQLYTHVAAVFKDGTREIRAIVDWDNSPDMLLLDTTDWVHSTAPGQVERFCFARKMRLDSDEMVEEWHTNSVMTASFNCIEVLDSTVVIPSFLDYTTGVS